MTTPLPGRTAAVCLRKSQMKNQDVILNAFRESSALIITPNKVYNLPGEQAAGIKI